MIPVTCGSCGAAFRAKDEHAGRRGKCPKCGEIVHVPERTAAPQPAPATAAGAVGPVVRSKKARRKASSRAARERSGAETIEQGMRVVVGSGGGRRGRRPKAVRPVWVTWVTVGVIVIGLGGGVWYLVKEMQHPDTSGAFSRGLDALDRNRLEDAVALLSQVTPEQKVYSVAQEKLTEARERMAAEIERAAKRAADTEYTDIDLFRKSWVDGPGPKHEGYASNCRYLLKLVDTFVKRYPDHGQTPKLRKLPGFYVNVARLEDPPTPDDTETEVKWRLQQKQYDDALAAIAEYQSVGEVDDALLATLRDRVQARALQDWTDMKALLDEQALRPGDENWTQVEKWTGNYLQRTANLSGLPDAPRTLHDLAAAKLAEARS